MLIAATEKNAKWFRTPAKLLSFIYELRPQWQRFRALNWCIFAHHGAYSYANFNSPAVEEEKTAKIYIWKAQINVGARMSSVKMNVSAVNCELSRGKSLQREKRTAHMKHYVHFAYSFPVIYYRNIFFHALLIKDELGKRLSLVPTTMVKLHLNEKSAWKLPGFGWMNFGELNFGKSIHCRKIQISYSECLMRSNILIVIVALKRETFLCGQNALLFLST